MFKTIRKVVMILLGTLVLALSACGGGGEVSSEPPVESKKPTLSQTAIELTIFESATLTVLDFEGEVEWSVSDYRVITVDGGVVTCVGVGEAIVTAYAGESILTCSVVCTIDYEPIPYVVLEGEEKGVNGYAIQLVKGDSYALSPVLCLGGEPIDGVVFTLSSDSTALSFDGVSVTAISVTQEAVVTVSCEYGGASYAVTCVVSVGEV